MPLLPALSDSEPIGSFLCFMPLRVAKVSREEVKMLRNCKNFCLKTRYFHQLAVLPNGEIALFFSGKVTKLVQFRRSAKRQVGEKAGRGEDNGPIVGD